MGSRHRQSTLFTALEFLEVAALLGSGCIQRSAADVTSSLPGSRVQWSATCAGPCGCVERPLLRTKVLYRRPSRDADVPLGLRFLLTRDSAKPIMPSITSGRLTASDGSRLTDQRLMMSKAPSAVEPVVRAKNQRRKRTPR